jgi:hypothetical protein
MHYFDQRVIRIAQDFKTAAWDSVHDHRITQEDIASSLGIDQGTVSRQMSPGSDLHLPAFSIAALGDERVKPLQHDIMVFLAKMSGHVVTVRPVVAGDLNGRLDDEVMDLAGCVGRIADGVRNGKVDRKKAVREFDRIRIAIARAEAELEEHP